MRQLNQDGSIQVVISSDPAQARLLQDHIEAELKSLHYEDREIFGIKLALEEALINAIKHGNQLDHSKSVTIDYRLTRECFEIGIQDEGGGFDPEDVPDPNDVENLERPCGRGLLLMRHYMTNVRFHPPGNRLTMSKIRNGHAYLNGNGKK